MQIAFTSKQAHIFISFLYLLWAERLAAEIDKQAKKHGLVARVLVEINSGNEESKGGIDADRVADFCMEVQKYENIEICGFMTMAPKCENKADYFPYFNNTKSLADKVWRDVLKKDGEPVISMGMSESYCEAVECGATVVRVGRSMFAKNV